MTKRLIFDVESVGLHGEGFAVGWVLMDGDGIVEEGHVACDPICARGTTDDFRWVEQNVNIEGAVRVANPRAVRDIFWQVLQEAKKDKVEVWTDCGWPVEANFLSACIADDPEARKWGGPYPLFDVANVLLVAGFDPLGTYAREPNELPIHNALNDARQSARQLMTSLWMVGDKK